MLTYDRIKNDLNKARKEGNTDLANDLKVIMGELARLKGTKIGKSYVIGIPTDEQVIMVLTGIIKAEDKTAELTKSAQSTLKLVATSYMPTQISEEELKDYINTIDFSKLKNKMQAIGIVKKHFGSSVDGKLVSDVIRSL